jgi:hypothetical protein
MSGGHLLQVPRYTRSLRTACIPAPARTYYDWMPTKTCRGEVHAFEMHVLKAQTGGVLFFMEPGGQGTGTYQLRLRSYAKAQPSLPNRRTCLCVLL